MPELPEVETTLRGLWPFLEQSPIVRVEVNFPTLRWPIPPAVAELNNLRVSRGWRRSKYILLELENGQTLMIHLGMSGRLVRNAPPAKHDHVVLMLQNGDRVALNDPRRFGMVDLWPTAELASHPLLKNLGPEPLTEAFSPAYLHHQLQRRKIAVKTALMDAKLVVGVGNIYANEALFHARISPTRASNRVSRPEAEKLVACIKQVLTEAIEAGGSSLRDYVQSDGKLGLFQNNFYVYDRADDPCRVCQTPVVRQVLQQRATFHCPSCQSR